jgi:hypothetical protein
MPYVARGLGDAGFQLLDGIGQTGSRLFCLAFDLLQRTGVCICHGHFLQPNSLDLARTFGDAVGSLGQRVRRK